MRIRDLLEVSEDYASCWIHKDLTVTTKIRILLTAARASGGKDEFQVRLTGIQREHWMGTGIRRLGGYGFQGTVTACGGSNQKGGKMRAGYVNLREKKEKAAKEGVTQRGRIQLEPLEFAAFVLALRGTPVTTSMLYFCDDQALLKAVKRWVGEGGKVTLVGSPGTNILREAIKELQKRTAARAATRLVKVKAHRKEPANEEADIQADKAISRKDVPTEWRDRTNRTVFTWPELRHKRGTVSYEDRRSACDSGVRKAIR